jgi:hypothetical protein
LTPEEIEDLLTNPDPQTPSHHQVDPRIIKAYLMGESVPTYLPREVPSHYYSGFLPVYLPRDRFEPSERVVPLVDDQYRRDYCTWKNCLDANTRATKSLVDFVIYRANCACYVCDHETVEAAPKFVMTSEPDCGQLRPRLGWLPVDAIKKTFERTTQLARMPMSTILKK